MWKLPSFSHSIRRVIKNFAANVFGQLANAVYQIVALPLFLHYWNIQAYGEWLVLFSIPNILWSLEGGLSGVAANRMTVASAAGNWKLVNSLFQNVFLTQGILTVVLLLGGWTLVSNVDLRDYFHFKQISAPDTSAIIMLLLCYMLTAFYLSLFRAAYRANELEHRGVMANNLWKLTDFCLTALVLLCHGHALTMAKVLLGGVVFWGILLYLDLRRICPRIQFGFQHASWQESKGIFVDGMPLLAGQAAMAFFLQGYPLVINRALGASAVVMFASVRTVSRTALQLNQVICFSSAPEVSRSYGRQDWPTYVRLLKIMLASAFLAGMATLVGLTLFGPWIIHLWSLGKISVGHWPLFLFAVSTALQGIYAVGGIVLVCSNMHHLYNYLYLAVTLVALALASFVLPIFGFNAVPATMVVQDIVLTILVFSLCKTKLNYISLGDLRSVFSSDFYWGKFQALFNRAEF
jgi:O-antigen/teichoic acid export membrane protein